MSSAASSASSGITVISGLALGVDSAAHEGALAGAGETVAVLGTGAERSYPRSRRHLYERIRARGPGAVGASARLADLPLDVPGAESRDGRPRRHHGGGRGGGALRVADHGRDGARRRPAGRRGAGAGDLVALLGHEQAARRRCCRGSGRPGRARSVARAWAGGGARGRASARSRRPAGARGDRVGCRPAPTRSAASPGIAFPAALASLGRLERSGYIKGDATGSYTRTTRVPPGRGREAVPSTIAR